jgi:hypothetical protein
MRDLTVTFYILAMAAAVTGGCSAQPSSTSQASTQTAPAPNAPIEFRVVPERNPAGCMRFAAALSRVHTFWATGDTASVTSEEASPAT